MIKKFVIAAIRAILMLIKGFDYNPEEEYYGPCWIHGRWAPEEADEALRRAQGIVFEMMERLGMPLQGWEEFDVFIAAYRRYKNIERAYAVATASLPYAMLCGMAALNWDEADKVRF